MTIRAFNSVQGFSVGDSVQQSIILANGDITTVNFTANGVSNLGPIGNVKITGGSTGQALLTDGTGNLSFGNPLGNSAAPMPYYVTTGNSYYVPDNFQGLFSQPITIDGTFEVDGILVQVTDTFTASNSQVLFDYNGTVTGNTGFTFDAYSGNLGLPGNINISAGIFPSVSNTYSLGSSTNRFKDLWLANTTLYVGNSSISNDSGGNLVLTNGQGGQLVVSGNSTETSNVITYGNSSITVNNANVSFQANNTANVAVITSNGITVVGNTVSTGIVSDNFYYANGQPFHFSDPGGSNTSIQFNANGKFAGSSNLTFDTSTNNLTVSGNLTTTNTISANYLISSQGCVTLGAGAIAVSGTAAGIFNSAVTDINIGLAANVTVGSTTGTVTVRNNLSVTGNVTTSLITGTLATASQPNVTSVGTLASLSVSGNISSGNATITNTLDVPNIKVTDLYSKRSSITVTTNTMVDTFPVAQFRSAKYTMRAGDGTDYQALEVLLVHNNINSIITVYGSLSTSGTDLVLITSDISAGNVNVYATAVGSNTNLNLMGTYVPD